MTTGLLTTTLGQAAIANDLAGGADLVLSHVAFGDSNGIPYAPNEAQVALVNERYRSTIASVAVVAGTIVVDAVIPADTPDGSARPSHGFNVAEAGLYSAAGTLIGLARMGNGYKPPPSSGQATIATFRFKLPVANPSAISVVIDPQAQVQLGRNVRPFWMTVDGVANAPPGAPVVGATYVIGAAPTGAWAGFANRLAQWVGVWALASVPEGHIVNDLSKAESNSARFLKRTAGGWGSAEATDVAYGLIRRATAAEIAALSSSNVFIRPSDTAALIGANKSAFNVKQTSFTARASLSATGFATFQTGSYTKKSGTSDLMVSVQAAGYAASTGAAVSRVTFGASDMTIPFSNSVSAQAGSGAIGSKVFSGLAAGALAWTWAFGRGDASAWTDVINPNNTDASYLPTGGTSSSITFEEVEP